jgi:hypothetical protein
MRTWIYGLCGAAALMAVSPPIQAQVVSDPAERARATDAAQPTPPGITVVEPRPDAVETFECRSLLTLLMVAIPPWEEAAAWFVEPFKQREPSLEQAAARQRCLDALSRPVVRFEANVPVKRPVDRVPRPGM